MKVYVSGPMRGYLDYNFPAFYDAERVLQERGHEVFSPARRDADKYGPWPDGMEPEHIGSYLFEHEGESFDVREAMAADLDYIIRHADVVVHLPGITRSSGSNAEMAAAHSVGVPVMPIVEFLDPDHTAELPKSLTEVRPYDNPNHTSLLIDTSELRTEESSKPVGITVDEIRVVSSTGGEKGSKLARYDLIPVEPLRLLAEHFGRGARKYEDRNWERGYDWSLSFAALQRHAWQFWGGEDIDPETGSPHMVAVAWHALALVEYMAAHPEFDNRPDANAS